MLKGPIRQNKIRKKSEKTKSCRGNLWNEIQGHEERKTQEQNKKEWASSVGLCLGHKPQHPFHKKVSLWRLLPSKEASH